MARDMYDVEKSGTSEGTIKLSIPMWFKYMRQWKDDDTDVDQNGWKSEKIKYTEKTDKWHYNKKI